YSRGGGDVDPARDAVSPPCSQVRDGLGDRAARAGLEVLAREAAAMHHLIAAQEAGARGPTVGAAVVVHIEFKARVEQQIARRWGRDREIAGTGARARWSGDTNRPAAGPAGHEGLNLGVRIHPEGGGSLAVKGHGRGPGNVAPSNSHYCPAWPTGGRERRDCRPRRDREREVIDIDCF